MFLNSSKMVTAKPIFLRISIDACLIFSYILAAVHYFMASAGFLRIPSCIREAPGGFFSNIQKIWFARLLKKVVSVSVRSPLRLKTLQLVNFDVPIPAGTGLVIVTCHTPWKRLLVQWVYENIYAIIIDTGRSRKRNSLMKKNRKNYNEMSHMVRYLRYGGCVIIAGDVFNKLKNCPSEILGKSGNLSLLPVRLARIAGVPLITMVPELRKGGIHFYKGRQYDLSVKDPDLGTVMQNILGFFEGEIEKDPSIWSYFVNDPLSEFHKKIIE
jgi:hypothetical protein